MSNFETRIEEFNKGFGLPAPEQPVVVDMYRHERFLEIITEELSEGLDVYVDGDPLGTLVNMADWLGDVIVYCASEARRHGIPLGEVLTIIMDSNMSKFGEDGKAIIVDGKVQKGPNYWKPEPKIRELLAARMGVQP